MAADTGASVSTRSVWAAILPLKEQYWFLAYRCCEKPNKPCDEVASLRVQGMSAAFSTQIAEPGPPPPGICLWVMNPIH
jgi:hypothetical protein